VIESLSDEFNSQTLDESIWQIDHFDASWKNNEEQCYFPDRVSLTNGNFVIQSTINDIQDSTCANQPFLSGHIQSRNYFLHGTIEIRARLPSGDGLWPAIWLLGQPEERWPACGEIDIMEAKNQNPSIAAATLHYGVERGLSRNHHIAAVSGIALDDDFHVWKLIRTDNVVIFYFDNVEFGRITRDEVAANTYPNGMTIFDAPMKLILNVAVGGDYTGFSPGQIDSTTWEKSTMEVDYVRTWSGENYDSILSPQTIGDWGYPHCGAGYFDVQNQGVANDYCRWVGNCQCRGSCSFWSCALAGTDIEYTAPGVYNEFVFPGPFPKGQVVPKDVPTYLPPQEISDWGYPNCGAGYFDVQNQGVALDYCRWVGNCQCRGSCSFWSCALAGTDIEYTLPEVYNEFALPGPFPQGASVPKSN